MDREPSRRLRPSSEPVGATPCRLRAAGFFFLSSPALAGDGARQRSEPRVRVQPGPSDVKTLSVSPPAIRYRPMGCQFVEPAKMTDSFRAVTPIRPAAAYIG